MSGHSKWSTIKRKKGAVDAKRGKLWTRLLREVTVSARMGGGDPAGNPRLRSAINDARSNNVPNDNIDRAIKKGTGELEGGALEEIVYEGYGVGGVAILIETITDNKNRTVSEIRHLFSRYGGNLGENGCVGWMFDRRGVFAIEASEMSEEAFMELAVEIGAEDVSVDEEIYEIITAVADFNDIKEELERREVPLALKQLSMVPQTTVEVDPDNAPKLMQLIEALEDQDDVQDVWANFEATESMMAEA
jgi:YebC/PmpR family DNA-binding regulatory protein